jgi:CRISPR-associated protein Cas5d
MFHGFDYPDETGGDGLYARFWHQTMIDGVIHFDRPEDCKVRKFVRAMSVKPFGLGENLLTSADELVALEASL